MGDEDKFDFQIHAHEEEIQAADCEKDKEQLNLLPVSYTHLDVYKRQDLMLEAEKRITK